ncbi:Transcription factor of morphogenesis MCM1, partial [Zancudomyces culisetae]
MNSYSLQRKVGNRLEDSNTNLSDLSAELASPTIAASTTATGAHNFIHSGAGGSSVGPNGRYMTQVIANSAMDTVSGVQMLSRGAGMKRPRIQESDDSDGDDDISKSGGSLINDNDMDGLGSDRKTRRRKIKIEYIEDKGRRHITFSKRKAGIMKKAYELSTLTGTQILLLVVSETGLVYTFTTPKLQPLVTKAEGKGLIQSCLNMPEVPLHQHPLSNGGNPLGSYPGSGSSSSNNNNNNNNNSNGSNSHNNNNNSNNSNNGNSGEPSSSGASARQHSFSVYSDINTPSQSFYDDNHKALSGIKSGNTGDQQQQQQ